jgi:hypothetical protein
MPCVAERILPVYVAALERTLDEAIARLPAGPLRVALLRLRRRLRSDAAGLRLGALHRLAILGEAQGWLRDEEMIVIRRLAYRVEFLLGRLDSERREP